MNKLKSKPIVVVDSDTLIFSAAAACEVRTICVAHTSTGKTKIFKNRTEFKNLMKAKKKEISDAYVITDIQEPEDISHSLKIIKNTAENILDNFSDCEVVFCATAKNNFRDSLPYPSKYKSNRAKMIKPLLLKASQEYFISKYSAVIADGHECDDEIAIQAYGATKQGRRAFILSPDGDSRQFDGILLGNYKSTPDSCIDVQFFHDISWDDKGFQSYGFPWMVMQHLVGDSSDGLNPTEICGKRYGEKGCFNDLSKLSSAEEMVKFTIDKYKSWYPSEFTYTSWTGETINADWKFMLELYWKGTTMKREKSVLPSYREFLKNKGIDYDW